ncbi:DUF1254 domain-containing protein [Acinetobacter rongchengensis]|uniref:DUF1254 domain-containing protein n=1 Tax=Acinetobacter rongchengensis TaxID=2419601 RepID=A0A3A8EWS9_9GAMM|nr:DUF1254 domain-containing protein [Acinetobacter rongchengensis]RKG39307.1 DUF1254 domain-containing protein [Acinetobacter rongchengensis]
MNKYDLPKKLKTISVFILLSTAPALISSNLLAAPSSSYPDPLLTTPINPDAINEGLEIDGYTQGVQAYIWGYPLVRMERIIREYIDVPNPKPATSYRAPLNQIGWAREVATDTAKDMPTPNNDTAYMSSVVKLDEPYILTVPDTNDRYYVVNVFNMWQELEHYIGRRTTGTKAGKFALVPPGWKGTIPAGITRLDVKTDKVWLWGRIRIAQGENLTKVHKLQDQFKLTPLSGKPKLDAKLDPMPAIGNDPLGFMTHLAFALKYNKVPAADEAMFAQFSRLGLTKDGFDETKMFPDEKKGLLKGLEDGPKAVVSAFPYSSSVRNGWNWATGMDNFGFNYPLRSLITGPYFGGNGQKEAMYPIRYIDSEENVLTGANNYSIHFTKAPPVNAFWSVTIYDADTKMLVSNPINRFKVGSDTKGLKINSDGSIDITIQNQKPANTAANWLPAPKGNFYLILRLYQPTEEVLSGQYALPQVVRMK